MAEEKESPESKVSPFGGVSSFASGLDDSLFARLGDIESRQKAELEVIRHEVLIARTLFEVDTKRALDGADEKTSLSLSLLYRDLDLGDSHE